MSEWNAKRFWTEAKVVEVPGGFGIALDARRVKTPAKADLVVPTRALAQAIATEWDAQEAEINPHTMPFTRSTNAALDKVSVQHGEVADLLAAYGDADLLCYRAEGPDSLIARQVAAWDPLLDWAADTYKARLVPIEGVMHAPQDPDVLQRLAAKVHEMDCFTLTAFHDLVGLSGSLIIGFAALEGVKSPKELWLLSRVDEIWQEEQWGVDEEAQELAALKESEFIHAKVFHDLATRSS